MDQRSPAAQATLFTSAQHTPDLDHMRQETTDLLEDYGEVVHSIDRVNDVYYLIATERLNILMAFVPEPLPLEGFLDARRPASAGTTDREVLERLTQSSCNISIMVAPAIDAARTAPGPDTGLLGQICWDLTEWLHGQVRASLIYWAEEEVIFVGEEFERSSLLRHVDIAAPQPQSAPESVEDNTELLELIAKQDSPFAEEPEISDEMRSWFEGARDMSRNSTSPEAAAVLRQIASLLPIVVTKQVDAEERRATLQRFSMAATSATVSLSAVPKVANIFL